MNPETIALIALGLTVLNLLVTSAKDLFGGGKSLSNSFHALERETEQKLQMLRNDFLLRSQTHEENARVGSEAISANIHALQLGLLEFRVKMAEEYMRRDSYYKAADELKKDFKEKNDEVKSDMHIGFEAVNKRLDDMSKAIRERAPNKAA